MENIQPGQIIGPYRIIEQIGQGGMATVYKAYHAAMDRYVAVKVLPRQLAQSPEFTGRFQQEARTIAKLEHPHILPVHDYGESDGLTYLVMRYLEAGTLKDRIHSGPMPAGEADRLFSQLADALDYAHGNGVVHRDLKPSNVLLDARGDLFLTDFGIAKLLENDAGFTATGGLVGTPAYMSPEQAQGQSVDQRSDIYSLGIILYEMVTGRVPFEAETPLAVVLKHLNEPLPLPSAVKPDINPAVERVLLKALAKNPDDRFTSTAEFLSAWKNAQSEADTVRAAAPAPPAGPPAKEEAAAPTVAAAEPAAAATEVAAPAARKVPAWVWALGGLGALALVVLIGFFALRGARGGAGATQPARTPAATAPGATAPAATARPQTTAGPVAVGDGHFTSWAAANTIYGLTTFRDKIVTWGPGGVTLWTTDGVVEGRLTTADGLPDARVHSVLVDEEEGILWIATAAGLVEYDGQDWYYYSPDDGLDSDLVSVLAWTADALVAGTAYGGFEGAGLNVLTAEGWKQVPDFPSAQHDEQPDKLSYNVTAILEEPPGVIWVGTDNGLGGSTDGQTWRRFSTADGLPSNLITALMYEEDMLFVGTGNGLAIFQGQTFEPVEELDGFPIYGMVRDFDGNYWFAGGGGIARFDPARNDWTFFNQQNGRLPTWSMYGGVEGPDGALYFGSEGRGLVRYDGRSFDVWPVPNTPSQPAYGYILEDPDGRVIVVEEYGVRADVFDPADESWSELGELPCEYCAPFFIEPDGLIWAGSDLGLFIIAPDDVTRLTTDHGLPSNEVRALAFAPDGTAWIGTAGGVAVFDGQGVREVLNADNAGFNSNEVRALFAASDGSMWVGLWAEIHRLAPDGTWEHYDTTNLFPWEEPVMGFAETPDGAVWVATLGLGVLRYADGNWDQISPDDPGVRLPTPYVNSVTLAPDGTLWFGTTQGAAHFDGQNWTVFDVGDGLIHWNVNYVLVGHDGAVWFATSGGVTRYLP